MKRQTDPYGKAIKKQKNNNKKYIFLNKLPKNYIFFVLVFCLLLHPFAVWISLPFHIFLQYREEPGMRKVGNSYMIIIVYRDIFPLR